MADLGSVGTEGTALAAVRQIYDRPGRIDVMTPFEPERCDCFISCPSGNPILDDAGAPAVRTVRIYNRMTGNYVTQTVSAADGTYSAEVADASVQHQVVCLDDAAGTVYNDKIHRSTPV